MLVRLRKVVFNDLFASLFAQIGFRVPDGPFVSQESELVVVNGEKVVNWSSDQVDLLISRFAVHNSLVEVVSGEKFAIDLTDIEMAAV